MAAEYLFCAISDFASPSSAGTDLGSLFSASLNSSMAASSWFNWLSATPNAMWLRGFSGCNRVAIRSSRAAGAGWLLCRRARDRLKWASQELGSRCTRRFEGGNRARYLLLLPKICAQGIVGPRRRVNFDRLFKFRRTFASGDILRGQVLATFAENQGRKREPSQSPREIPSQHSRLPRSGRTISIVAEWKFVHLSLAGATADGIAHTYLRLCLTLTRRIQIIGL